METEDLSWRKSSFSNGGASSCVEVGRVAGRVLVRDTKDPERRVTVSVPASAWSAFIRQIRNLQGKY